MEEHADRDPANADRLTAAQAETEWRLARLESLMVTARQVQQESGRFLEAWPPQPGEPLPAIGWYALARQLRDLAGSPAQARLVDGLLESIRSWSDMKPAEMVLRELLCLASVVLDEETAAGSEAPEGRP